MSKIILDNVRKSYDGKNDVIKGVSLTIDDGEFLVLVGPSGCGKSTLLRMIAGLESITDGTISISDRVVNDIEPSERDIAMVFQNYALYPHMTVRENLAYGLKNRKTPKKEIERRIEATSKSLEIHDFLDRKPRQLSGGQRQRVAMGRAIVREPAAFLFDEPLSNLDAKLRVQMRVEIKRLQRALATTSVYVTHDQMEAMTLADRLVVLNSGRIEQVGTPIELYEKPATTFVATFIGSPSMNLLPLDQVGNSNFTLNLNTSSVQLADIHTIGVRPEDVVIVDAEREVAFKTQVHVDAIELVGAESYIHSRLNDDVSFIFRVAGRSRINVGDLLHIGAEAENIHLFNADGKRINI